jgi:geranylgeranyl diphosphate synthase, type II
MSAPGSRRYERVQKTLRQYQALTINALLERVPAKEPRRHLWDLVASYPKRAGKGFRPGLCIATCRAFGGSIDEALESAVAIELFHNAFLVHDDVEDDSEYRRGKMTLHAEYGIGIAVNVGDAMNVLTFRPLMENLRVLGPVLTWRVFQEIEHMVHESVEGQAMELGWVRDNNCDLTTRDYLRMTLKKTCWYTCIHPCRLGALIATDGSIDPDRFNRFGYYMGAAFQIQDDILNLIGDRRKYGKEIGGDLWEGKRTMMLIHALNHATASENSRLRGFLATPRRERQSKDVRWVYSILAKYDSIERARSEARQLAGAALREFFVAYAGLPDNEDKQFIQEVVLYMIERDL